MYINYYTFNYVYTESILFFFNLATSYIVSLCNRLYFGSEVVNCE